MSRSMRSLGLVLLVALGAAPATTVAVEEVPSPRPRGWTVDLTGTLRAEDVQALDRLGEEVKAQTGAELAVVVIDSTGGRPHREFATALANRWGIGDPEKDNGVLVFAALADRAAEIVLGDGIDGPEQTRIAEEVMQGEMVPRFRAGEPGAAVFYGALACAQRLLGARPTAAGMPSESAAAPGASGGTTAAAPPLDPAALEPAPVPVRPGPRLPLGVFLSAAAGGLALLGGGGGYLALRRSQACRNCRTRMVRLDEAADDAHLSDREKAEERVGSVDHDVWACPSCGRVEKVRRNALFTRYAACPTCGARTVGTIETVLRAATTREDGLVKVDWSCAHCDYRHSSTRTTPRLQESDRPDVIWGAPSRSSSSSSFSSSSRSSRSSRSSGFSGGRSSGGGASGRW